VRQFVLRHLGWSRDGRFLEALGHNAGSHVVVRQRLGLWRSQQRLCWGLAGGWRLRYLRICHRNWGDPSLAGGLRSTNHLHSQEG
jgi:hypothetical protein